MLLYTARYILSKTLRAALSKYLLDVEFDSIAFPSLVGGDDDDQGGWGLRLTNVRLREGVELITLPGRRRRKVGGRGGGGGEKGQRSKEDVGTGPSDGNGGGAPKVDSVGSSEALGTLPSAGPGDVGRVVRDNDDEGTESAALQPSLPSRFDPSAEAAYEGSEGSVGLGVIISPSASWATSPPESDIEYVEDDGYDSGYLSSPLSRPLSPPRHTIASPGAGAVQPPKGRILRRGLS